MTNETMQPTVGELMAAAAWHVSLRDDGDLRAEIARSLVEEWIAAPAEFARFVEDNAPAYGADIGHFLEFAAAAVEGGGDVRDEFPAPAPDMEDATVEAAVPEGVLPGQRFVVRDVRPGHMGPFARLVRTADIWDACRETA